MKFIEIIKNRSCQLATITCSNFIIYIIIFLVFIYGVYSPHSVPDRQSIQTDNYFNLVQLSDIHINKYNDRNLNNFKDVCNEIPLIEPDAVIMEKRILKNIFPIMKQ